MKRILGALVLSLMLLGCLPLPTAPAPVATWTPFASATATVMSTPSPTVLQQPTLTTTPVAKCESAEEMQQLLRAAANAADVAGSARGWQAKDTLTVEVIDNSSNTDRQYECLFAIRLWVHENPLDDVRNVEKFSIEDLYTFIAISKTVSPDTYVALFTWNSDEGQPFREQIAGSIENNVSKVVGGIYLYTQKIK